MKGEKAQHGNQGIRTGTKIGYEDVKAHSGEGRSHDDDIRRQAGRADLRPLPREKQIGRKEPLGGNRNVCKTQ